MKQRRSDLIGHTRQLGCHALVTFNPENLFYMTGFWGEAVGLLEGVGDEDGHGGNKDSSGISETKATIIVPELEAERARSESVDCDIVVATGRGGMDMAGTLINSLEASGRRPCTDCGDYATITLLDKILQDIEPSSEPFDNCRMVKDAGEIKILRDASRIIDGMFELCSERIKAGQSESELQAILMSYAMEHEMFDTGYRFTMNPLIVAGGPNGALPHAQVTSRKFRTGELAVVDITLRHKGYVSDATRTFALGSITPRAREAYEAVRESQQLGLDAARHGAVCRNVDAACRKHIESKGYGSQFIHSTGHGIGLDVHEKPAVSAGSKTVLERNMAITVEPGIYVRDEFGIRIEDSLIVTDGAPLLLHNFAKELITV